MFVEFMQDDRGVRLRDVIGVDNLLWGNDFPHAESTWPKSREFLDRIFAGAPDEDRRKITADNAARRHPWCPSCGSRTPRASPLAPIGARASSQPFRVE